MSRSETSKEPIAIVGSACRFAGGVTSPSKLWELLQKPRDVRQEIPVDRFGVDGYYHSDPAHHGRTNVRKSYLLDDDPSAFDAEFFNINPIEGRAMDPQQRILLETVYDAIESGGMTIEGLRGSDTAVFAGLMVGDYETILLQDLDVIPTYCAVGNSRAILSNRISYFFDWHGASVTMDTACSSSLVAMHYAIRTLRAGDSRMAVACGANVILGPYTYVAETKVKMLSPDGVSRMWDKDANGYARGDGVAALVLKPLSAAIEDNDHIECIIRETGLNQDGSTAGLTMPSPRAQSALIDSTYSKAGLDLATMAGRPQFFEAHGTGTPAGDPAEAEAISTAFFGGQRSQAAGHDPLFVGSIKTVLGHTEGTAGIAGVLKASLAIQNACIPPNLLFDSLSPAVAPFYRNLEIVREARPWPVLPEGMPRRASVNSFGFGGTNAHAILESYQGPHKTTRNGAEDTTRTPFTPYVFSAASESALRANLNAYADYLEAHPEVNPRDLAYTLRERRSVFPHRVFFPATNIKSLQFNIRAALEDTSAGLGVRMSIYREAPPKLLGIFTGQGAQYARMGAQLITKFPLAKRIIQDLESHLSQLPKEDRPTWSLEGELLADTETSRMNESDLSQPLNTAVQILLVDLLQSANIHFDAVAGHSSGEIAAAYAAGYLSARDALCIAYYRGINCRFAKSPNREIPGAMLAVGTSREDAIELCEDEEFAGRLTLAAVNSSSSVTISGDEDAIEDLMDVLEEEKMFHRRLHVDKAYHSMHMVPTAEPYLEAMRRAGIRALTPDCTTRRCTWYSSVFDGRPVDSSFDLDGKYWVENLLRPVLFAPALSAALSSGTVFDAVIEVGPHPALQSPSKQTIQDVLKSSPPCLGILHRQVDATESFTKALGALWSTLGKEAVDLQKCEVAMADTEHIQLPHVLKNLPTYQWNHDKKYWHESRRSRFLRTRQQPWHPLLGDATPDSGPHALRWKNILKPDELEWLKGHSVQNQVVFPAAGYISTAIEAARVAASENDIRLIELENFHIHQAITFSGDDGSVEVLIELTQIVKGSDCITARFTYSAALGGDNTDLTLAVDGDVKIILGEGTANLFPHRQPPPPYMINIEESRLYDWLDSLEYNFTGPFRSLVNLRRKRGRACCMAKKVVTSDSTHLLLHPVDLDSGFQSINLAYSYPGDQQLRSLHLPTTISKVRVNPEVLRSVKDQSIQGEMILIDSICNLEDRSTGGSGFSGNVNLYLHDEKSAAVQVDHIIFKPVGTGANSDRKVFLKMDYVLSKPDGGAAAESIKVTEYDTDFICLLNRMVNYYLSRLKKDMLDDPLVIKDTSTRHYLDWCRRMSSLTERGQNPFVKNEWENDTVEDILANIEAKGVADTPDVQIIHLTGRIMPEVFRGETNALEHLRTSGLLDQYYTYGFGVKQVTMLLGNVAKQITDRHPHLQILEVGAGTGGATKCILNAIHRDFHSYTFTDISPSFFETAADIFSPWQDWMIYKVYDAEHDPTGQGFIEGSYDLVIAYHVLHATRNLSDTLQNLRKLLKPGGYLVIGEYTSDSIGRYVCGFIFGTLPGWWAGVEEGRTLSPMVNPSQWDTLLRDNGFSGIDTMSPPKISESFGVAVMISQAVDLTINTIRSPLSSAEDLPLEPKEVILVGGASPQTVELTREIRHLLEGLSIQVYLYEDLESLDQTSLGQDGMAILSLTDLDHPVFEDITPERFMSLKKLFTNERSIVWVTHGRLENDPYSNMSVGFGRAAANETAGLRLQYIDIPDVCNLDARSIVEAFLRFNAKHLERKDILYTIEPEIVVDSQGRDLVPRLRYFKEANDRLNSNHRLIVSDFDTNKAPFELKYDNSGIYYIRQLSRYEIPDAVNTSTSTITLSISHAIVSAIKTPMGYRFLVIGSDDGVNQYLALVPSVTSVLEVSRQVAVRCQMIDVSPGAILVLAAAQLLANIVVHPLITGQKILIHNASEVIAQAVEIQARSKGVTAIFSTDKTTAEGAPSAWIHLPAYLGRSEASKALPSDMACFVGLSTHQSENENTILSTLSPYCQKETVHTLFSPEAMETRSSLEVLGEVLKGVIAALFVVVPTSVPKVNMISLEALLRGERATDPLVVVNLHTAESVPARVTRYELIKQLFKPDRTYWLCGLSGSLGISLCDWMIQRGTRNIVLTSRNPKIHPDWVTDHAQNGVIIESMPCDVTDEQALRAVHQNIVETFPPIAGALNGAMVLRDVTVSNMEFDDVTDVIRPKVLGSIHLDRIFHDVNLDFFVLLSSTNCIISNPGQANYAAANMGVCGVAANRMKRGLRSSVANIGTIIGIGYIAQYSERLSLTLSKQGLSPLNEEDFHQIFAEAIDVGHLDSPDGPEITTGIPEILANDINMPKWCSDPKFSRLVVHDVAASDGPKEEGGISILESLQSCQSQQDVFEVIKKAFSAQLRKTLQISTPDDEVMEMRGANLGLDSLISVDVRSWFIKHFQVSMPVLKIMASNAQMSSLVNAAVERIPADLIPHVQVSGVPASNYP